jgi:hypothetical protein
MSVETSGRTRRWVLVAVGVAIGALVGLVAAMAVSGGDDAVPPSLTLAPVDTLYPPDQAANADAFLRAWDRYRHATFRAELTFTREVVSGARLSATRVVVQQPPRRMVRQDGSVTSVDDDQTLVCEPHGDQNVCNTSHGDEYEAQVATELAAWRTAITGDNPAYAVDVPEPGCFDLTLVQTIPDPPYGDATRVCFDDASGALRSRTVNRATGTESETATAISPTVTDADWETTGG